MALCFSSLLQADPITPERAKEIARAYLKTGESPRLVQKALRLKAAVQGQEQNAPYYVYSRGDGQGFVIVSGDDCLPEVIGYTESGDFDTAQFPPALLDMLGGYAELVTQAQEAGAPSRSEVRKAQTRAAKADIAPLLTSHWHQSAPYNNMAPLRADGGGRSVTGCVATAAAQVIYYWRRDLPAKSGYDTPTYGYGEPVTVSIPKGTPYKWELLRDSYADNAPAEMKSAVANLNYIIGTSTWLTYGSSTSGHIDKLIDTFSGQFNVSSVCHGKYNYSQSAWENLVYADLELGRPIVYSGVHATNGGHAIVLDGYRASDGLFHFNFGWGGQGDGYYTLDDETGVNGFASQQWMTYQIRPRSFNIEADIEAGPFLQNTDNPIRVTLTNNSTVPYKGLYLFCSTSSTAPNNLSRATRKDVDTEVPSGESYDYDFVFPASATGLYYIFVTDANLNILARLRAIRSEATIPDLTLRAFSTAAVRTTDSTLTVDGVALPIRLNHSYNNKMTATARVYNGSEGTFCQPTFRCEIQAYDEAVQAFGEATGRTNNKVGIDVEAEGDVSFNFISLKAETVYRIRFVPKLTAPLGADPVEVHIPDSVIYVKTHAADLSVVSTLDGVATLSGHWNADVFGTLSTDATVTAYDLTAVTGVVSQPEAANPNALFYVADDCTLAGRNLVRSGNCANLVLSAGHDFRPITDFRADKASFTHEQMPAIWTILALPFECTVPQGAFARKVNLIKSLLITECDSVSPVMSSCTPHLCMTASEKPLVFEAEDVLVSVAQPNAGTDTLCANFVNRPALENELLLSEGTTQYFEQSAGEVIPAFSGYLAYENRISTSVSAYRTKDIATKQLASVIAEAEAVSDTHREVMGEEVFDTFLAAIAAARADFTRQPVRADLIASRTALEEAMEAFVAALPKDELNGMENYTTSLANPSFEQGSVKGWTVDKAATGVQSSIQRPASQLANFMVGHDGLCVFYTKGTTNNAASISQVVTGLPNGRYEVRMDFATEEALTATLFANEQEVTLTAAEFGPMYFSEFKTPTFEVTDGTLTLGVRGGEGWYKVDNFRLYYKGAPTPVEDITADEATALHAVGGAGCIHLTATVATQVSIVALNGVRHAAFTLSGTRTVHGLAAGLYVVNGKKVLVR